MEYYRQRAEDVLGREIEQVTAEDEWFLKRGTTEESLRGALLGRELTAARRRGKLLLLDVDDGSVLGLRFGMTGRLLVDGTGIIQRMEYGSDRDEPAWDRFSLRFNDGGTLVLRDPRRLGGVVLDPLEDTLGPDAAGIGVAGLRRALDGSTAPLKARLMDQTRIAGLGNLLTDEILWRAGLAPAREAGSLDDRELRRLQRTMRRVIAEMAQRGGSHTGDLHEQRHRAGVCPRDGEPLRRETVGGRTTYWCPHHQL